MLNFTLYTTRPLAKISLPRSYSIKLLRGSRTNRWQQLEISIQLHQKLHPARLYWTWLCPWANDLSGRLPVDWSALHNRKHASECHPMLGSTMQMETNLPLSWSSYPAVEYFFQGCSPMKKIRLWRSCSSIELSSSNVFALPLNSHIHRELKSKTTTCSRWNNKNITRGRTDS